MRASCCLLLIALSVAASADEKPKEKPKVTGKVVFAKRPTFPEGAEVKIQVQDVSIADKAADVLGEKLIKGPKLAPIPFEVEYDASKVRDGGRYSLSCRITHGGKLLYINDTNIPVLTGRGKTKDVELPVIEVER